MIVADNLDQTLPIVCNTADDRIRANALAACKLPLPWLDLVEAHDRPAIVVGGGPSMRPLLPMIRALRDGGAEVYATNGTVPVLYAAGIASDHQVLLDARPENVAFVAGPKALHYLIASQCHPDLFRAIAGHPATLWHPAYPEIDELGHRKIHLFGFDSSYSDAGEGHAYAQPLNDEDDRQEFRIGDQRFIAAPWMARQAMEFQVASRQLIEGDAELYVHGKGLLPAVAAQMGLSR
jgi:hypothetical protein